MSNETYLVPAITKTSLTIKHSYILTLFVDAIFFKFNRYSDIHSIFPPFDKNASPYEHIDYYNKSNNAYSMRDKLLYFIRPLNGSGAPRDAAKAMFRALETFKAEARNDPGITKVRRYKCKIDQNSLNSM